jgi:hypothetical protein
MTQMSDYLENKLIDHIWRGTAFTQPTNHFIRLYTAAPGETGGGTEVSGGSYAAINLARADANWANTAGGSAAVNSGTGGLTSNLSAITFAAPTANWGVITHMSDCDAATGNLIVYGPLTTSKTVNNGDPAPSFPIAALTITFA